MSSIAAGTTTGSALVSTGDTTGELVLKTNGTTTAVTIDTSQNVTIAGDLTVNGSIVGAAGSFIFLSTADFSDTATADFTLPAGYDAYQFVWGNVIPATDNVNLLVRTSTDGGANYDLTTYDGVSLYVDTVPTTTTIDITTASGAKIVEGVGSAANEDGISGIFTIFHPHLNFQTRFTWHFASTNAAGREELVIGSGARDAAGDVDAVRFLFSAGNIESGTITLYGMKNS
jgi:hypothetical protein